MNIPDATGYFPIHLACSRRIEGKQSLSDADGTNGNADSSSSPPPPTPWNEEEEDLSRLECVKLLLEAGTPISIKDGNKQTILHPAASLV